MMPSNTHYLPNTSSRYLSLGDFAAPASLRVWWCERFAVPSLHASGPGRKEQGL